MSTWNKRYHWKTKDCTLWAKGYFTEHLVGTSAKTQQGQEIVVKSLDSFEGDVELGNRKGKLITIYDCSIKLTWSGDDGESRGTIHFPEVSHEVEDEGGEYQADVQILEAGDKDKEDLLQGARTQLIQALVPALRSFREAMIKQHAADLGHDDVVEASASAKNASASGSAAPSGVAAASKSESAPKKPSSSVSRSSQTLRVSADLAIQREELWDLLTDPSRIPMWTRAPAQFNPTAGEQFSLFGGNVSGTIKAVEKPSKLVQDWRLSQWPSGHFATLALQLSEQTESTKLDIELTSVPAGEEEASTAGLETFYIRSLKALGLGTIL